ncbi:cannabinoid receptor 2 [Hyperolius riggenbachi]|uniref:cannabinoid receptor 2 n=1 Tax=Hyperolius riggenbachi TaxID=752182 RepID=UPI0035A2787A
MSKCNINASKISTECVTEVLDIQCYLILDSSAQIFIAVLCIITGVLCILENSLVLTLIFTSVHLRKKPSFLFIASLALADLLASCIFSYSFVDFHVFHGAGSPSVFLFKLGGVTLSFTSSLGSLLLTAFDRYICIHKPAKYKAIVTKKRALQALTVMWIGTTIISYLPLMGLNCCQLASPCSELFPLIDNKYLASWISIVVILLCAIIFFYAHILWKAHGHTVYMKAYNLQPCHRRRIRMDIKLAKTLALVLTVLVVCWTPALMLMIHSLLFSLDNKMKAVFAFVSTLCLFNSMVNPVIYARRSRQLRRRLFKILQNFQCLQRFFKKPEVAEEAQNNLGVETTCDETAYETDLSL